MKKFFGFLILLIVLSLFLVAFKPLQETQPAMAGWQDVFKMLIFVVTAAAGAPVAQLFKNLLGANDRWALLVTGAVAGILAFLELWLSKALDFSKLTLETYPGAILLVFGVASVYYAWFKNSPSFFGQGGLLKGKSA